MRKAASFSRLSSAGRHEGSFTRPPNDLNPSPEEYTPMRSATNRVPVLARLLPCALAFGCAALLGLPTTASAGTILNFGQESPTSVVLGAVSGSTLTLDTNGGPSFPSSPTSIPILITQLGTFPIPGGVLAFETFEGVTSAAAQVGSDKGGFSGTIIISGGPGGTGQNILTTTFAGGTLTLPSQGSGSLNDAQPPFSVSFTSANPDIEAILAGTTGGTFALALANISPSQIGTFTNFTAQNSGVFSTLLSPDPPKFPSPASMVMALWAVPLWAVLGMLGYRPLRHRYKSSKA